MKYDVIIIGTGLGGLLCGYTLSKHGYKVALFEQHHQLGGCLQVFQRNGTPSIPDALSWRIGRRRNFA